MAYKVFANGFPLPASDLNNFLMNQSVIVFADNAARSGAIASPVEGMITYLESTQSYYWYDGSDWLLLSDATGAVLNSTVTTAGDLIVADGNASVTRLGIGSSGQVLGSNGTTATWVAPYTIVDAEGDLIVGTGSDAVARLPIGADGQALLSNGTTAVWGSVAADSITEISSTSLSGASVTFSSIPQTYKELRLVIRNFLPVSDSRLRLRVNGVTTTTYFDCELPGGTKTDRNYYTISDDRQDNGGSDFLAIVEIKDYANTTTWKLFDSTHVSNDQTTPTDERLERFFGGFKNTSAISSITLFPETGDFSSGTAILYGVK